MNKLAEPQTADEKAVADGIERVLEQIDPNETLYPRNMVHFQPETGDEHIIAELRFDRFPEIPPTEFGTGTSSLQMKEQIEAELMEELDPYHLGRKTRLVFEITKNL